MERTWTTFGVSSHQNATIISWSICAACGQVFVKGKVIRLFFGSSLQLRRRSRSEYGGCDLSQVSLPRLEGPKSIIGQKLGCIMYCRNREGGKCECMCVCAYVCLLFCPSCHLKSEHPLAAGNNDISGTRELKHCGRDRREKQSRPNHQAWQLIASARHRHPGTRS